MELKNRKSNRLKNYDYSQNGMYFITICTKNREHFFGEIKNGKIVLNESGRIAEKYWKEIPKRFPFVNPDDFIIMPNHIHGIIEINRNQNINKSVGTRQCLVQKRDNNKNNRTRQCLVPTNNHIDVDWSLRMSKISPKPKSLPVIIGSYKSIVSKTVFKNSNHIYFAWQSRYYDHIIRNYESLNRIREYIQMNTKMWERDRNNIENIWI